MPRLTHADPDRVYACPECDVGGDVYERTGKNTSVGDLDATYCCGKCSATFDEPVERERKRQAGKSKLRLEDCSPEDVGL